MESAIATEPGDAAGLTTVDFTVKGWSMWPLLRPGDRAFFAPCDRIEPGEIVLYAQPSSHKLVVHRALGLLADGRLRVAGDFTLEEDPPIPVSSVLGRLVRVERSGRSIDPRRGAMRLGAGAIPLLVRWLPHGLPLLRLTVRALGRPAGRIFPRVARLRGQDEACAAAASRRCAALLCAQLRDRQPVRFIARGSSMWPALRPGAQLEVVPFAAEDLLAGDLGAYKTSSGALIVHRVVRTLVEGTLVFRGDAMGEPDPPVDRAQVLGKARLVGQPRPLRFELGRLVRAFARRGTNG